MRGRRLDGFQDRRRSDQSSGWSTKPIVKPEPPQLSISYDGASLVATWNELSVDGYVVQFFDPQQQQLGPTQTFTTAQLRAAVALPEPVAGAYTVRAKSLASPAIGGRKYRWRF